MEQSTTFMNIIKLNQEKIGRYFILKYLLCLVMLCFSCQSYIVNNPKFDNKKAICKLTEGDFYLSKDDFHELIPSIQKFEESKNENGILYVKMYSKNAYVFHIERYADSVQLSNYQISLKSGFYVDRQESKTDWQDKNLQIIFDDNIRNLETGFFVQDCNIAYEFESSCLFLVKKNGKIMFKYFIIKLDYHNLIDEDKAKIKNLTPIIDAFYEIEKQIVSKNK